MRRIEARLLKFIVNRDKPFTVHDVFNSVKWDGSRKHLSRYLTNHPRLNNLGKRLIAGQYVNVYEKKQSASDKLFGLE